jgi:hypothetical protein
LGKYLLSKGTLKPVYYVFSDDEILYDASYAGGKKELAKETSDRIQKDTQRIRTLYEHDGVESRILSLNGHTVDKARGHGWQARVRGRTEEMPLDQAYGFDTIIEEKMGADDRNLIRNFIGNSTIGEQTVPTWNIASLLEGSIENVNVSSSSPNVGIKRPVLDFEIEYTVEGSEVNPSEITVTAEDFDAYTGLERSVEFLDNFKATISDGEIVFSVIEENVEYDLQNFEFEFYEIENKEINPSANNAETEQLKKLYFADDTEDSKKDKYIEHYFEITTDQDLASLYGTDIYGTNRFKVRDKLKEAILRATLEEDFAEVILDDIDRECE